eukprot:ANDGO_02948.mRNA.1 Fructose-1-phosphate phosphatase YqaB
MEAVIFDLDGTLVNSEPTAIAAVVSCFQEWNLHISEADADYVTGRTWGAALDYFYAKYSIPLSRSEAEQQLVERYRKLLPDTISPVKGAAEFVRLVAQFYPVALVTGSQGVDAEYVLKTMGIRECFGDRVFAAETYPRSKPDPIGFLTAAKSFNVDPSKCLVFEDSTAGIAAAKAAGMTVVVITSTNLMGQDQSAADRLIADFTDIPVEPRTFISQFSNTISNAA